VTISTASSIKEKQLPAHSVSNEIYSGIARFALPATALFLSYNPMNEHQRRLCVRTKYKKFFVVDRVKR